MIGAGLELWAGKFVRLSKNQLHTVKLSEGISLIKLSKHHHDDFDHHHGGEDISDTESGFANPHIWLDPNIAKLMVNKIISVLCITLVSHLDSLQSFLLQELGASIIDIAGDDTRLATISPRFYEKDAACIIHMYTVSKNRQ